MEIPSEDLKVELVRRPPGGQHVGTDCHIRVTHIPTGLVAECKSDRSQHRNRSIAIDMLLGGLTSPHMR